MTKFFLVIGAACIIVIVIGVSNQVISQAQVPSPFEDSFQQDLTIPYSGILSDKSGNMSSDGSYDLGFSLYGSEIGGEPLWSELQEGVMVANGAFVVSLGSSNAIPPVLLGGEEQWLATNVRGPDEKDFTLLTPRQRLSSTNPASLTNQTAGAACAHDHWGETWEGDTSNPVLIIKQRGEGLGIRVDKGVSSTSNALEGGTAGSGDGVSGYSSSGNGVYGGSSYNIGVYAHNAAGTKNKPALRAESTNTTNGMAAYLTNKSSYHTAHFQNEGNGGVLFLQNSGDAGGVGGGEFITAVNGDGSDPQFRVQSDGQAFADGGWQGAADFAELMAVEGQSDEYEPGDVLVISTNSDRTVEISNKSFSTMVIGVYSTNPGFIGSSHSMESQRENEIPVAVMGIVPCKVTTENGAIHRGDLLVTSSLPGYAMRTIDPPQGAILGKALEDLDASKDVGIIQILVTLQ